MLHYLIDLTTPLMKASMIFVIQRVMIVIHIINAALFRRRRLVLINAACLSIDANILSFSLNGIPFRGVEEEEAVMSFSVSSRDIESAT